MKRSIAPPTGAVDDVVTSFERGERRELHRLLQEALRRPVLLERLESLKVS
jgi:hypothetical protein